ncbi:uncharacterized protein CLAFUR5_14415 [Fulvia fulva]|uniref:Uncharacterized protein n=1 Tax=Passalora fulva TaxID=5499 RepID=A0A9Q8PM14_PASFU|nr:uncharacterized protein CLAFUR5_14415 [Fulvia fulva]UJO24916.1 hypothetical protein CLAFUR5_14415 [Fulvia fulva]
MSTQPDDAALSHFQAMTAKPRHAFTPGVLLHNQVRESKLTDSELRIAATTCVNLLGHKIYQYAEAATAEIDELKELARRDQLDLSALDNMSSDELRQAISVMVERRWAFEERKLAVKGLPPVPENLWKEDEIPAKIHELIEAGYRAYASRRLVIQGP